MADLDYRAVIPIVGVIITGLFTVLVAYINKQNKPVRDILRKTKIQGDGSLIEAIGVLQKQREKDQKLFEEQIAFYRQETIRAREDSTIARERADRLEVELNQLRDSTDDRIKFLMDKLDEHDIELHLNGK